MKSYRLDANSKRTLPSEVMRGPLQEISPWSSIDPLSTVSPSSEKNSRKRNSCSTSTGTVNNGTAIEPRVANCIRKSTATALVPAIQIEDDNTSTTETVTDDEEMEDITPGSLLRRELTYTKQIGTPLKPSSGRVCTDFDDNCALKYSVGRTRAQLTKHIDRLKLNAAFGTAPISSRKNKVSHITLSSSFHYLPQNQSETLEFWLEEGIKKLVTALILDPAYFKQDDIPIFWARPNSNNIQHRKKHGSGELCHYIGHYRCISFRKIEDQAKYVKFRFRTCQAVIDFQFQHYCERLHNQIAGIDG
jgi:hypothetical protein